MLISQLSSIKEELREFSSIREEIRTVSSNIADINKTLVVQNEGLQACVLRINDLESE